MGPKIKKIKNEQKVDKLMDSVLLINLSYKIVSFLHYSGILRPNDVLITGSRPSKKGPKIQKFKSEQKMDKLLDNVLLISLSYKIASFLCYSGILRLNAASTTGSRPSKKGPKIQKFNNHRNIDKLMYNVLLINFSYKIAGFLYYFGILRPNDVSIIGT